MATNLDNLVSDLTKVIKSAEKKTSAYDSTATVTRVDGDTVWVHIPGGVDETPVKRTVNAQAGDEVQIRVGGGRAWIVGNATAPPTDDRTAMYVSNRVDQVEGDVVIVNQLVAEKASVKELEAEKARIDDLEVNSLTADSAVISDLQADTAKIHNLTADELSAATGYISDLTSDNITAANIVADHGTISNLNSNYAHIKNGVIDNAKIGYADVNDLNAHYANLDFANVDTANITEAWIKNLMVQGQMIAQDGTIYRLTGLHLSANDIDAGQLKADRLLLLGDDGLYYAINVNSLGESYIEQCTEEEQLEFHRTIHADVLTANSITVDKITTNNLVGTGGWINLARGTFEYENATTGDGITWDGQHLSLRGSVEITSNNYYSKDDVDGLIGDIQDQVDGVIDTWYYAGDPTASNAPASSWTTDTDRYNHLRDLYFNTTNGHSFRWAIEKTEDTSIVSGKRYYTYNSSTGKYTYVTSPTASNLSKYYEYKWIEIKDADAIQALADAATAQETADGKRRVFTSQPTNAQAYDVGDLWVNATYGETYSNDVLRCKTAKAKNAAFNISHWQKASKYTDDSNVYTKSEFSITPTEIIGKVTKTEAKISGQYAVSSTAAGTAAKVATITPAVTGWELTTGTSITVKFTNANTAASPTLNVNSTGAKAIKTYANGNLTEAEYKWSAGSTFTFTYNGTNWLMQDSTMATRLSTAETNIIQNAEAITLRAYQNAHPNLSPYFSSTPYDRSKNTYWKSMTATAGAVYTFTDMGDGWMRVQCTNSGSSVVRADWYPVKAPNIKQGGTYTWLVEYRNNQSKNLVSTCDCYLVQTNNCQFWGGTLIKHISDEDANPIEPVLISAIPTGTDGTVYTRRFTKLAEVATGGHWTNNSEASVVGLACWTWGCGPGATIDYEVRISVYEGEYRGPYKPYSGDQLYSTQAELKVASDEISTKVSKDGVISSINQSAESVKIKASKVEIDGTAIFSNSDFQSSLKNSQNAYTILWDVNADNEYAGGEAEIRKYDPETGTVSQAAGWAIWNGVKRTVPNVEFNPNNVLPYNIPIYLVLRLTSSSATTGTVYPVWYNDGWKYNPKLSSPAAADTTDWAWVEATDIILGKCVEPGSEAVFTDCEIFDPPYSSKQVTTDVVTARSANALATTANTTANNAAPKANAVKRTQRIYYQNNSTTAPATPGTATANWVTDNTGAAGKWTKKRMSYSSSNKYIWTCEQSENAAGTVSYTSVLLDDTTTVIDGGNIITGTIDANRLTATVINAINNGTGTINADKINVSAITVGSLKDGSSYSTTTQMNSAIGTAKDQVGTGLGIKWNTDKFAGTYNAGEAYFCLYNSADGSYTDANGWVMFNGVKRTVPKGMQINPNTVIPYNTRTYMVLRLSSATATTGTMYYVYYNSGWKSVTPATPQAANIADWTWAVATDIVLCSYVEPGSEAALVEYEQYTPVRTAHQITAGNTAYQQAATAQSTANTAQTAATNAAKTATNYITANSSGIKVHASGTSGTDYTSITSNRLEMFSGGNSVMALTNTGLGRFGLFTGNYLQLTGTGMHLWGLKSDSSGAVKRATFSNSGVNLYQGDSQTEVANLGASSFRIGTSSGYNTYIDTSGMKVRTGTTVLASFGTEAVVGQVASGKYNTRIYSDGMQIRDNTTVLAEFKSDSITLGNTSMASINLPFGKISASSGAFFLSFRSASQAIEFDDGNSRINLVSVGGIRIASNWAVNYGSASATVSVAANSGTGVTVTCPASNGYRTIGVANIDSNQRTSVAICAYYWESGYAANNTQTKLRIGLRNCTSSALSTTVTVRFIRVRTELMS